MDLFIIIAIIAYLAFAGNGVIDKFLLKSGIPEPAVYAFYIGILGGLVVLLIPFGFALPGAAIVILAFISGIAFVYALVAMFESLKLADASLVLPGIGAMVPAVTLILSFFWVGERLNFSEILGLVFLIIGSIVIASASGEKIKRGLWLKWAIVAGVFFALSFTLSKIVYIDQNFVSGLIWIRLGSIAGALTLLFSPAVREKIFQISKTATKPTGALFLAGQALGAGAGILQSYAVSLGSVTLVNGLQGTQFGFLILLTWILYKWFPKVLKEDFSRVTVIKKIFAVVLISVGLVFIAR